MRFFSIIVIGVLFLAAMWIAGVDLKKNTMDNHHSKNVLGEKLKSCCTDPMTGFYRTGTCETGPTDFGTHVICAEVTEEFLKFSRSMGNDLISPRPEYHFPGLKAGDKWCLCALRWKEALEAGHAPPVVLEATHQRALDFVSLEELKSHAISKKD
jgi:uncharacterized protein (DUF2237 family)